MNDFWIGFEKQAEAKKKRSFAKTLKLVYVDIPKHIIKRLFKKDRK